MKISSSSRNALVAFVFALSAPLVGNAADEHVLAPALAPRAATSPPATRARATFHGFATAHRPSASVAALRRASAVATPLIAETFSGSATTPNAWTYGGNACITAGNSTATLTPATSLPACGSNAPQDLNGSGALELTPPKNFQTGFAFNKTKLAAAAGLSVTFDYFSFNSVGTAGDGLALVLTDASAPLPTKFGGCCGSLGYASYTNYGSTTPGLTGAYLGIALDETGYFTASNEGKTGGTTGLIPNIISARGAAATNEQYLVSSLNATTKQPAPLAFALDAPTATTRPTALTVNVSLTAAGLLSVSIDRHDGNGSLTYLGPTQIVGLNGQPALPANFYLGFTSSGGGANARHQLRNLTVTTLSSIAAPTPTPTPVPTAPPTTAPTPIPPPVPTPGSGKTDVLTYHGDANRTGWNATETTLTTANVNAASFGLLHTVALDGRVDAQPLIVSNLTITGAGVHDVAYVVTENNTLYAIDAESGTILGSRHVGTSIPYTTKDNDDNVYPVFGILSTPVIDRAANAIYFVSDANEGSGAPDVFRLHKVALDTLNDIVAPVALSPGTTLSDGTPFTFPAQHEIQRPALLEANGTIYVAFGSTGDTMPGISRGIIAGFNATNLAPLASNVTTDRQHELTNPFYLTSIWQSGYGPAADAQGNVYFATGNSDNQRASYDGKYNFPDSVLKVSADLSTVLSSFTQYDYFNQDQGDGDLGSGGTLVVPDQTGGIYSRLALAGGKDGKAYLLNRDALGGFTPNGPNADLAELKSGNCWCGPAYFKGADGQPRLVTSGSNGVMTWKLTDTGSLSLALEGQVNGSLTDGQPDGGGTIPTISSNGTTAGSAIIWFVQRPLEATTYTLRLRAFGAANLSTQLFAASAGNWTNYDSNADIVPTVANGHVYVGSYKQLQIFGLLGN